MTKSRLAPWLSDSQWPTVPIRLLARLGSGHTPSRSKPEYWQDCTIPWITLADVWQLRNGQTRIITETKENISSAGLANSSAVKHPAGTVILSRTASVGFSAIMGRDMATSQDFATWTCGPNLESRYLLHALRGMAPDLKRVAMGSTHKTIYMPDIEQLRIPLPPLEEQRRIADFLDYETSKLDNLVTKKQRLVSLMNERIDSRVLHHVDTSQLVKPSADSPVLPIRRVVSKVIRPATSGLGVITAYRDGQVTDRASRRAEGYTLSASTEPQGQAVEVNDVVVHGLDGFAGAIGVSEARGNCSPVYHVCVPLNDGDSRFIARLLRLLALQGYLGNFATSTRERAVDFRNWDLFGRIPIPVVPTSEQHEIGELITSVRPLSERIDRSAVLVAERHQALITAAVTGQFDVSTASGRNVTEGVSA
ncbi:restriction endonuclease subunit S [Streptomyces heliomycini]|uniref:Restriction endonuclease subunit S n=1 Tax=Streptomyces heliomycini TaxID=284032 RepID=A0ABV5LAK7_9ACTN